MLFWQEHANDEICSMCGDSRWKPNGNHENNTNGAVGTRERKIPAKVLRYFPLKPRLQRLFMSTKMASLMTWHENGRIKDGFMRHPVDSPTWKEFDAKYPKFAAEPRNVRLGLENDGINPFRTLGATYSTWPVVLILYNFPPWMCMKQPYLFLSLIVPGPNAPRNDIDVYLQPVIAELKELSEDGVETYNASTNQNFQLRVALLTIINDFPAYGNLSGWSTKGRFACPSCNSETCSQWLKHGQKFCYMGHRRFLDTNHRFRYEKQSFDGNQEFRVAPTPPSGTTVLHQLDGLQFTLGKKDQGNIGGKRKRNTELESRFFKWKKRSIFILLPYWQHNLCRHNLDVMHIEKNICDNLIGTLLNLDGKTKDNVKARLDLRVMRIRPELHPQQHGSNFAYLPLACYSLSSAEKEVFCRVLKSIKAPDGYASNISQRVDVRQRKIWGLKSHDCHVLMQQLLPLAMRRTLPKNVYSSLTELCNFFRKLCSKVLNPDELCRMERKIALILCRLERIFPPSWCI
ncbi:PREDICTED: uncharacterized protein LOC104587313 [Nelumbo nucifera]|uniref:Uncharacterized protein LOC104587313 n=1 Tax=Nelumbo nucifera TaxID=4432 RepID=A0A1U8Q0N7_NELNU|nr:PREDICTED: uncharacterized protein LOC104587313 [Nelumbo nucifera]